MKSFEELLQAELETPAPILNPKDDKKTIMPMEAMVKAVMNKAMHGDISAITFIRNTTDRPAEDSDEHKQLQRKKLDETIDELVRELQSDGYDVTRDMAELELVARQLVILREIGTTMESARHQHIVVTPQKNGSETTELSTTNKIFNDLYKAWKADWRALRQQLLDRAMQKKILTQKK